ncbi:hypothetical protein [Hyphococcus sp.]|uniref:hypothetical protein n=1 Tax=Hyphococcus sp. TaxID=2038636 RepID=UPI0035C6E452
MRVLKTAILAATAFGMSAGLSNAVAATYQIGDYEVDDAWAASSVTATQGEYSFYNEGSDADIFGDDLLDGVQCVDAGCELVFSFNRDVVNGDGNDLIIAGIGGTSTNSEKFDIVINGVTLNDLNLIQTGEFLGRFSLKALAFDLSDFGVAAGEAINSIKFIVQLGSNPEELTFIGALDDDVIANPIPAAAWLFGTAIFGGGYLSRKKRKTA